MSTEPSRFRPPGAKTITALASLAASVATVLALFVVPGDNGPGSAEAAPVSVERACRATQKGWDDQARREAGFRAAVRHGRTALAQRDAIIDEVQARIASSGAAMSTLRAAGSPAGEAGARYDQTLRVWSRNLRRLQRYRDALSAASSFGEIRRAALANDHARSAFERDARTVMAGLQALGGEACQLEPPPPTPVTHLNDLGGGGHHSRPNVVPHGTRAPAKRAPAKPAAVQPSKPASPATPDVAPGDSAPDVAPAPDQPDVAPDVVPPIQPVAPDAGPPAGDGPETGDGASAP
jgi:hypothetical protein